MLNPNHEIRRQNLKRMLDRSGLNATDFARKIGISRSYLSQMLGEGFRFGEKAARSFEEKLRLNPGAFDLAHTNDLTPVAVWDKPSDLPDNAYALVPRVAVTLSAGAGTGVTGDEEEMPPLAFRADWLKKKNVTHKSNLRTCDVRGDSMEPYLFDDDTILIDTGQSDIEDNQIYAIRYADDLRIKRLSRRFDGGLLIRSDNPKYADEPLTAKEAEQIHIIGKLIWRGGAQ